jgi:FkbM family methyltransferase
MQYYPPFSLKEVKVIVDIGANVGYSALYFAHLYKNAKIFAIEPEKNNFSQLQKNCQHEKRISTHNFAVSDTIDTLHLVNENDLSCAYRFEKNANSDITVLSKNI